MASVQALTRTGKKGRDNRKEQDRKKKEGHGMPCPYGQVRESCRGGGESLRQQAHLRPPSGLGAVIPRGRDDPQSRIFLLVRPFP